MNNTQTACIALLASAFLLAGILVVRIDQKSDENAAMATGQVISQPGFTLMTAQTRGAPGNEEDSLFILDNTNRVLLVYTPNIARKQLEPTIARKVPDLFR